MFVSRGLPCPSSFADVKTIGAEFVPSAIKGEIFEETQIYAVERDGKLYGYNTWYLFKLPDDLLSDGGILLNDESSRLVCVADSIGRPTQNINLEGRECLINIDGDVVMYIELDIEGEKYAVASSEDVIAVFEKKVA